MDLEDIDDEKRLSKRDLEEFIYNFIQTNQELLKKIKVSQQLVKSGDLYILRCEFFTKLVEILQDKANISDLSTQHDLIKSLIHFILNKGTPEDLEIPIEMGQFIDFVTLNETNELKTRSNVPKENFKRFIMDYFERMTTQYTKRRNWWFVVIYEVVFKTKKINTESCLFYLIVFKIDTNQSPVRDYLREKDKKAMGRFVEGMVEKMARLMARVDKEDKLTEREAVLMPTKNYLLVENLRKDRDKYKDLYEEERRAKEEERRAKEQALEQLRNLSKENEELKKKLSKSQNKD